MTSKKTMTPNTNGDPEKANINPAKIGESTLVPLNKNCWIATAEPISVFFTNDGIKACLGGWLKAIITPLKKNKV